MNATPVQNIARKRTEASRVGIIFSLEPVFAGIVAYFFAGEILTVKGYIGVIIMILAILFLETDFNFLKVKNKE